MPMFATFEQPERLLNAKQEDEKVSIECTKRFKQAQDNIKLTMGTEWLKNCGVNNRTHKRNGHRQAKATQRQQL